MEHEANGNGGAVAVLSPPRLPYHPAIQDRFGVDKAGWKALTEAIFPTAKSTDSIVMALSYCRARNLDPFKRPVHIVPMWDSKKNAYVETIWPGIAELRTTAFRTGQYAGCDETEFGPMVERTFKGIVGRGDKRHEAVVTVRFPEWARVTVYRDLNGQRCKYVGPKVLWLESYATIGNTDVPNEMWSERPEGQLEKCAEAAALRKAFPEEIGNMLTAEEMAGRRLIVDHDASVPSSNGTAKPRLNDALDRLAGEAQQQPEPDAQAVEDEARAIEDEAQAAETEAAEPADALLSKDQLISSIGRINSVGDCLAWVQNNEASIAALAPRDRADIDRAFMSKQAALKRVEQVGVE